MYHYLEKKNLITFTPYEYVDIKIKEVFNNLANDLNLYSNGKELYNEIVFQYYPVHLMTHVLQYKYDNTPNKLWDHEIQANTIALFLLRENHLEGFDISHFMNTIEHVKDNIQLDEKKKKKIIQKLHARKDIFSLSEMESSFVVAYCILKAYKISTKTNIEDYIRKIKNEE